MTILKSDVYVTLTAAQNTSVAASLDSVAGVLTIYGTFLVPPDGVVGMEPTAASGQIAITLTADELTLVAGWLGQLAVAAATANGLRS